MGAAPRVFPIPRDCSGAGAPNASPEHEAIARLHSLMQFGGCIRKWVGWNEKTPHVRIQLGVIAPSIV